RSSDTQTVSTGHVATGNQGVRCSQPLKASGLPLNSASIRGSATLCFARWTQRRGRQLHGFQYCCKHGAWLLTEKALRCRRPVRPGEEKVMNDREARPLTGQIESSQLMAAQG